MNKIQKAFEHYKNGEWNQAIDVFSAVLETECNKAEIYNNIGMCYSRLDDFEKAEKYYMKALFVNPKIPQIYINLADIYYKNGNIAAGVELLSQGVCELPEDLVLRHYLARFYMEDSRLDLAIDELDFILDKQPENFDAYYDLGKVHFELGDYDSAIENFENVLEFKPDNVWVYYYLAQAYEANDEIDKGISNYLKSIAHNPGFKPAYKKAAILFMARGDYADAAEYFEDYLKMDLSEEEVQQITGLVERIKSK